MRRTNYNNNYYNDSTNNDNGRPPLTQMRRMEHTDPRYYQDPRNYEQVPPQMQQKPPKKKHHGLYITLAVAVCAILGLTMYNAHESHQAAQNASQAPKTEKIVKEVKPTQPVKKANTNPDNTSADVQRLSQQLHDAQVNEAVQQRLMNAYQRLQPSQQIKAYKKAQQALHYCPAPFMRRMLANYIVNHYTE